MSKEEIKKFIDASGINEPASVEEFKKAVKDARQNSANLFYLEKT